MISFDSRKKTNPYYARAYRFFGVLGHRYKQEVYIGSFPTREAAERAVEAFYEAQGGRVTNRWQNRLRSVS